MNQTYAFVISAGPSRPIIEVSIPVDDQLERLFMQATSERPIKMFWHGLEAIVEKATGTMPVIRGERHPGNKPVGVRLIRDSVASEIAPDDLASLRQLVAYFGPFESPPGVVPAWFDKSAISVAVNQSFLTPEMAYRRAIDRVVTAWKSFSETLDGSELDDLQETRWIRLDNQESLAAAVLLDDPVVAPRNIRALLGKLLASDLDAHEAAKFAVQVAAYRQLAGVRHHSPLLGNEPKDARLRDAYRSIIDRTRAEQQVGINREELLQISERARSAVALLLHDPPRLMP